MTQAATVPAGPGQPGPLGAIEAIRLGWRLMMSDFWRLWLVAFVQMLILMAANSVLSIIAVVVVLPPLAAGMFYVVGRRIDGQPADLSGLFNGFQQRFGQSVLGFLPVAGASMVLGVIVGVIVAGAFLVGAGLMEAAGRDEGLAILLVIVDAAAALLFIGLLAIAFDVSMLFFVFLFPAVWDHPESGWAAVRASMRLVRGHFWPVLGLVLIFWLLAGVANFAGLLVCCIGILFTGPAMVVWETASIMYLYRSCTGRPLVQPIAGGPLPPAPAGPSALV
jgi:hypothetical protein